jgi:hypothetical protein
MEYTEMWNKCPRKNDLQNQKQIKLSTVQSYMDIHHIFTTYITEILLKLTGLLSFFLFMFIFIDAPFEHLIHLYKCSCIAITQKVFCM